MTTTDAPARAITSRRGPRRGPQFKEQAMHILAAIVLGYFVVHVLLFRHHRRRGFGVFYSLRGPFHTWIRITKRF